MGILKVFFPSKVACLFFFPLIEMTIQTSKEFACNAGDLHSIPGLGRSPGEGNGYPLHYIRLENSMDCTIHGVAKSRTQLSDFHFTSESFTYFVRVVIYQFSSVTQLCPTLCNPMNRSKPGLPVHHPNPRVHLLCPSREISQ